MRHDNSFVFLLLPLILIFCAACSGSRAASPNSALTALSTAPATIAIPPTQTEVIATPSPVVPPTPTARPGREWARVLRVWDGNTVLIENGLSVRYLGIETPGGGIFDRPIEPFGREAAERNVALVEGKQVEIEQDVSDADGSGFLLRHVYVDGVMVNEVLMKEGLAKLAALGADTKYRTTLEAAQAFAQRVPLNIWTLPTPTPSRTPTPSPTETSTTTSTPIGITPSTGSATPRPSMSGTPTVTRGPLSATPTVRP
ncbi:MAG: hypothetical protein EXR58_02385 [Chloroflexi bacterium]|nr:hypothetical protein [Chloroflexota bacterium]